MHFISLGIFSVSASIISLILTALPSGHANYRYGERQIGPVVAVERAFYPSAAECLEKWTTASGSCAIELFPAQPHESVIRSNIELNPLVLRGRSQYFSISGEWRPNGLLIRVSPAYGNTGNQELSEVMPAIREYFRQKITQEVLLTVYTVSAR